MTIPGKPQLTSAQVRNIILDVLDAGQCIEVKGLFAKVRERVDGAGNAAGSFVLTVWGDMIRQGLVGWGTDLQNPAPPWFHISQRGQEAIKKRSHDPSDPDGYLNYLGTCGAVNRIAWSYVDEAVRTYSFGFHKSAAVNIGIASESIVLELRDSVKQELGNTAPKNLTTWQIKTVITALETEIGKLRNGMPQALKEAYDGLWGGFLQHIRSLRNDAGHPNSVNPVTAEQVHGALLIFPLEVKLIYELKAWLVGAISSAP